MVTCVPGVHDELGHLEGVSLQQPLTRDLHLTGVSDLRLTHHDLKGTVGHMFPVLLHADHMFAHFLWRERDPCREELTLGNKRRMSLDWFLLFRMTSVSMFRCLWYFEVTADSKTLFTV